MKDSSILNNIVATVHSLRSAANRSYSCEEEEDEVENLTDFMLVLESQLDTFGDLEVVKRLKSIISKNLPQLILSNGAINYNPSVHVRKSVFECVKEDILIELIEYIQVLEKDSDELLKIDFELESAYKKKKSDGYFTSFNFDDLPEYEPLEVSLKLLRSAHCNEHVIQKILDSDIDELVEHPQWKELLLLIRFSLYNGNEQCKILSLQLHIRLASELPELQAGEVIVNLLNYLLDSWKLLESSPEEYGLYRFGGENQNDFFSLDCLSRIQVSIFVALLKIISEKYISPSMENEGDHIIASVFILLTQAIVPVIHGQQNEKDKVNIPVQSDPLHFFSLLDVLAVFTVEDGAFLLPILRRRHPSAVLSHAVQSGLIGTLKNELESMVTKFLVLQPNSYHLLRSKYYSRRIVLYSQLLLSLLLPFASNRGVMRTCCESVPIPSITSGTPCQYLWNGDKVLRENARFKEACSTELLQSVGNLSVSMTSDPLVNKLMSQVSGATSVLELIIPESLAESLDLKLPVEDLMDIPPLDESPDDGKGGAISAINARTSLPITDGIPPGMMLVLIARTLKTLRQCQLHQNEESVALNSGVDTFSKSSVIDNISIEEREKRETDDVTSLGNLLGLIVRVTFSSSVSSTPLNEIINECASFAINQFEVGDHIFLKFFLEALDGAVLSAAASSISLELLSKLIPEVTCITNTILDKFSNDEWGVADTTKYQNKLEIFGGILSLIFRIWYHILRDTIYIVHTCDIKIAVKLREKIEVEEGKRDQLTKDMFAECIVRLAEDCLLCLGVERREVSKLSYVVKLKNEIKQQSSRSFVSEGYAGFNIATSAHITIELLTAIADTACSDQILAAALQEHNLVSDIISVVTKSLSLSSIELQRDRDVCSASCIALSLEEETRTSRDEGPENPKQSFTAPTQNLLLLIPTFNDCTTLNKTLLRAVETFGGDAVSTLFSFQHSQDFIHILRKEELSPYVWEISFSEADEESSMIPLFQFFFQLISLKVSRVADYIISICIEAWEPLKEYCMEENLLLNLCSQNGATLSTVYYEGIASKLLDQIELTGGLNGVENEGIGPYIIRLLYNYLSARLDSSESNIVLPSNTEDGYDLMSILQHAIRTSPTSTSLQSEIVRFPPSNEIQLDGLLNLICTPMQI
jgi:hypothetical protein